MVSPGRRRVMRCGLRLPNRAPHSTSTRSACPVGSASSNASARGSCSRTFRGTAASCSPKRTCVTGSWGCRPPTRRNGNSAGSIIRSFRAAFRRMGPPFFSASRAQGSGRTTPPASGGWTVRPPCVSERAWPGPCHRMASGSSRRTPIREHWFILPTGAGQVKRLQPGRYRTGMGVVVSRRQARARRGERTRQAATLLHSVNGWRSTEAVHARGGGRSW